MSKLKRGRYLPELSAEARARWAYQLAVASGPSADKFTVESDHIEHAGASREAVESLIDSLAAEGALVVMRPAGSLKSHFRVL
jgi:hypothetical protein